MPKGSEIDLENRDPNNLNSHIAVCFEDVLAEPEGAHACDCVWKNSFTCFECGKNCCYKLLTTLCGICIALFWGCDFAITAFNHVWCYTPCLKQFTTCIGMLKKVFDVIMDCCLGSICTACGLCLSNIKISKS